MFTDVTGTNNNDFLFFQGEVGQFTKLLVNPYTGFSVLVDEEKNINNGNYDGLDGFDILIMSDLGDVLQLNDGVGNALLKNIEFIAAGEGGDVINLADPILTIGDLTIDGGGSDDILWANVGNDTVRGFGGNDIIDGGPGNDFVTGDGGNDTINGGAGADFISGGNDNDTLQYTADAVWPSGFSPSDLGSTAPMGDVIQLQGYARSFDVFDGGSGVDKIVLSGANDAIFLNDDVSDIHPDANGTQRIFDVETIEAGDGHDLVDLSSGSYGDVTIRGENGNDILWSSDGNDSIFGGNGKDNIFGGAGDDIIDGGADNDTIDGGDGHDTIDGGDGINNIKGGAGNDVIDTGNGNDTIDGGAGHDKINAGIGNDRIDGGDGRDQINGEEGNDRIDGGGDDDTINAGLGDDVVDGGDGNDTIDGGDGNDQLNGEDGDDTILGGNGLDLLRGGTGNDFLHSGEDNDRVYGGEGDDDIFGVGGNDMLMGDAGADNIRGGGGEDRINGGDDNDFIDGDSGLDLIHGDGGDDEVHGGVGNDQVFGDDGNDRVFGDSGNDRVFGDVGDDFVDGGSGMDFAYGGVGNDDVHGGDDNDRVFGDEGDDIVNGDAGNDLVFGGLGNDIVRGGADNDTVFGNEGNDRVEGGAGNDILYGGNKDTVAVMADKDFVDDIIFPKLIEGRNIKNLKPPGDPALGIFENNLSVDFAATATITFRKGFAGYNNTLGVYNIGEDGTISMGTVLWANVKKAGIGIDHQINIPVGEAGGEYGFFILANGDRRNKGYKNLDITGEGNVKFVYDHGGINERAAKITDNGNDVTVVYDDGVTEKVLKGPDYHTTARGDDDASALNFDGKTHVVSGLVEEGNSEVLRIGFEDLPRLGDADYEDVLFDLDINETVTDVSEQGNDILIGGAGNDRLFGEGGDDILVVGEGFDTINPGTGSDTIVYDMLDANVDAIFGFELGAGGDVLNLTDILEGFDPLSDAINDFVQVFESGGNTEIKVNADGDAGGEFTTLVVIDGVSGQGVQDLIDSGNLVVDQSVIV